MTTKLLGGPIKNQIITDLQALVSSKVLANADTLEAKAIDKLLTDYANYPVAVVFPTTIKSDASDNADNLRTYEFDIILIEKAENISGEVTGMEDLIDQVLNKFDTDFTLQGMAVGGVLPVKVETKIVGSADKWFFCALIIIEAKALYALGT